MSSERKLPVPTRIHLASHTLPFPQKVDIKLLTPDPSPLPEEIKPTGGILTTISSWLKRKQTVAEVTNWAEQFNEVEQPKQGLVDIFRQSEVVESKNIISTGGGDANIEAAISTLESIQIVNAESVKRGEPHQQIPVSTVPKIMGSMHGAEVKEVSLKAPFQDIDPMGQFVKGDARAYAYQVIPHTEHKLLQAERTQQEIAQALVPIRREITMATIEAQTNMVVVAGVTNVTDSTENNQKQLNEGPQPHSFWNTEQPEISYNPGYDTKKDAA